MSDIQREIFKKTQRYFLSPIQEYLDDHSITEIMINGPYEIYIEQKGKLIKTDKIFRSPNHLLAAARNIAQFVGKRITHEYSRIDCRLPDGSRAHIINAPAARNGLSIAIRKFGKDKMSVAKLVSFGSMTPAMAEFIQICILAEKNILVSGGTSSGKTSLLNAISEYLPNHERIIVLEDSSELQLKQEHVVYLEAQQADRYGKGGVTIGDLFQSCLRMRPDRIIIGEVRGGEALDMLQAMTSGHGGSMTTNHANTAGDALRRLETMALMSATELPLFAVRSQVSSAIDVVIQTLRFNDGTRRLLAITEVLGVDDKNNYIFNEIFKFKGEGESPEGKVLGKHVWTGQVPQFAEEVIGRGLKRYVKLTPRVFNLEPPATPGPPKAKLTV